MHLVKVDLSLESQPQAIRKFRVIWKDQKMAFLGKGAQTRILQSKMIKSKIRKMARAKVQEHLVLWLPKQNTANQLQ